MLYMYDLPACELTTSCDTLRSILDKHASVQSKALSVRPRVLWFDEDKELKIKRRKLERKMRKSKLDISAYRVACREYNSHRKDAKKKNYSHLIEECAGDSIKLFQVV